MTNGPGNFRSMPDDFTAHAKLGNKTLQRKYGAGKKTIIRWLEELATGAARHSMNIPPEDFAELAQTLNKTALQKHYGVGERRVKNWLAAAGIEEVSPQYPVRRFLPDDFTEVAPTMTQTALGRHYAADWKTVKRWCAEANVEPAVHVFVQPPQDTRRIPYRSNFAFHGHAQTRHHADLRTITMYDEAADVLRRERFICFRCGPTGKYLEKGLHWRVGNVICTPDELLQRADKYRAKAA